MLSEQFIATGANTFFTGVKMLGAITVAFFILLFALLVVCFYGGEKILNQHEIMVSHAESQDAQLDRMEQKMDSAISKAEATDAINSYFLREICIALQDTKEGQKRCNPDPASLTR